MSHFIKGAVSDICAGRETWRVRIFVMLPAFAIAVAVAMAQMR